MQTQISDTFQAVWAGLTADGIAGLLSDSEPKVKGHHVVFQCPSCGQPEAYAYEPQTGKGVFLHCNRRNNCGFDQPLFDYLRERHGGDGGAALHELAAAAGVRLPQVGRPEKPGGKPRARSAADRQSGFASGRRSSFGTPLRRTEPACPEPPATPSAPGLKAEVGPEALAQKQAEYRAVLESLPPEAAAVLYLRQRGLTQEQAHRMNFGFCEDGLLRGRVTYPLTNREGQAVAIEGRLLPGSSGPKCLCEGQKADGVFVPRPVLNFNGLIVTEGVMDAAALSILGQDAVALCGSASLPEWLRAACCFKSTIFAFDADPAGDAAFEKFAPRLTGATVRRLRPPLNGTDWGDFLTLGLPSLLDAYWQANGDSERVRQMRGAFLRLCRQADYLKAHERTARHDRQTLLGMLRRGIDGFAAECDLPSGYTDVDDPWASDAVTILRQEAEQIS